MIEAFAGAVEASQLGGFARGSSWAYPLANLVHLLGLVLLVGGIGLIDLRVAGALRAIPLSPLLRSVTPLALAGLALLALSGPVMFAADAAAMAGSNTFRWKLVLIALALLNALAFRRLRRGREGEPTAAERALAVISLALWLTVAALGRMIAYY